MSELVGTKSLSWFLDCDLYESIAMSYLKTYLTEEEQFLCALLGTSLPDSFPFTYVRIWKEHADYQDIKPFNNVIMHKALNLPISVDLVSREGYNLIIDCLKSKEYIQHIAYPLIDKIKSVTMKILKDYLLCLTERLMQECSPDYSECNVYVDEHLYEYTYIDYEFDLDVCKGCSIPLSSYDLIKSKILFLLTHGVVDSDLSFVRDAYIIPDVFMFNQYFRFVQVNNKSSAPLLIHSAHYTDKAGKDIDTDNMCITKDTEVAHIRYDYMDSNSPLHDQWQDLAITYNADHFERFLNEYIFYTGSRSIHKLFSYADGKVSNQSFKNFKICYNG